MEDQEGIGYDFRKVLQDKIREEKKKTQIDVRKGTGQVSYMKFFKPPKPVKMNPEQVT